MVIRTACIAAALACAAFAHAAPPDPPAIVPPGPRVAPVPPPLTEEQARTEKMRIEEQYDHSQIRCRKLQSHARELCNEEARAERDVQSAELQMRVAPSADNDEKVRLAKAEGRYAMALVKCKSLSGTARGICRKDAKDTLEASKVEARLQKDVVAQALRSELTVRERAVAAERVAEAQYRAARERCEMLPGEGRANCLNDAKTRFGKL